MGDENVHISLYKPAPREVTQAVRTFEQQGLGHVRSMGRRAVDLELRDGSRVRAVAGRATLTVRWHHFLFLRSTVAEVGLESTCPGYWEMSTLEREGAAMYVVRGVVVLSRRSGTARELGAAVSANAHRLVSLGLMDY